MIDCSQLFLKDVLDGSDIFERDRALPKIALCHLAIDDAINQIATVCAYYFSEPATSISDIIFKLFMLKIDK